MQPLWKQLHQLFESDLGSLPDIYIESLTGSEVVDIYEKVMSQAGIYDEPTLWSIEEARDVPVKELADPAVLVIEGRADVFRHGLTNLTIGEIILPDLTIFVEPTAVSFDYRTGPEWGPPEVEALFEFLWNLVRDMPHARVFHTDEGSYEHPTEVFSRVWDEYSKEHRTP